MNFTVCFLIQVIESERPTGVLLSFGGQTALNCGVKLQEQGVLEKYQLRILGTPIQSIINTEDRQLFSQKLAEIDEKCAPSEAAYSIEEVGHKKFLQMLHASYRMLWYCFRILEPVARRVI